MLMLVYRLTKTTTFTSVKEILKYRGARLKSISVTITVSFMHSSYYGKVAIYSEYCKEQFVADSVSVHQSQTFLCFLLFRCRSREMAAASSLGSWTLPWFLFHNRAAASWCKERIVKFVKNDTQCGCDSTTDVATYVTRACCMNWSECIHRKRQEKIILKEGTRKGMVALPSAVRLCNTLVSILLSWGLPLWLIKYSIFLFFSEVGISLAVHFVLRKAMANYP
jgi:hypothetical protein